MTTTQNEEETRKLAYKTGESLEKTKVIYLTGDLGSGKTAFTKGLAEYFEIDHFTIKSPTYTYIRKHKTKNGDDFYHIDLYRIEEVDELLYQEINELFENEKNIVVIEWADRFTEKPHDGIDVKFKYIDKNTREITIDE